MRNVEQSHFETAWKMFSAVGTVEWILIWFQRRGMDKWKTSLLTFWKICWLDLKALIIPTVCIPHYKKKKLKKTLALTPSHLWMNTMTKNKWGYIQGCIQCSDQCKKNDWFQMFIFRGHCNVKVVNPVWMGEWWVLLTLSGQWWVLSEVDRRLNTVYFIILHFSVLETMDGESPDIHPCILNQVATLPLVFQAKSLAYSPSPSFLEPEDIFIGKEGGVFRHVNQIDTPPLINHGDMFIWPTTDKYIYIMQR